MGSIIKRKEARERAIVFFNDNLGDLGGNATLTAQFALMQTQISVIETAMRIRLRLAATRVRLTNTKTPNAKTCVPRCSQSRTRPAG